MSRSLKLSHVELKFRVQASNEHAALDLVNSICPVPTCDQLLLLFCSETSILGKHNSNAVDVICIGDEIVEFPIKASTAVFEQLLEDHHPWSFTADNLNPGGKRQRRSWKNEFELDLDIMGSKEPLKSLDC